MDLINILFAKALNKGDATKEYVNEAIKALKGEVSADLDTLEELSRALGNDPDFFLTVKNEIDSFKTELVTNKDAATENTRFAIGVAEQNLEVPSMEEFNQLKDDVAAITPDDTVVNGKPWTSEKIVEALCPPFETTGSIVQCHPVEHYPLGVVSRIDATQSGTGDPSPDNIRPIVGWDSVTVTRCGKNLLDFSNAYVAGYDISGFNNFLKPNTTYSFRVNKSNGISFAVFIGNNSVSSSPAYKDKMLTSTYINEGVTDIFTTPEDMSEYPYLLLCGIKYGISNVFPDVEFQIEIGSTATAYEPYTGDTYTAELPEIIYGGTLDWNTGVLTATHGQIAAYAGESLPGAWISDRDVYADGAMPTTGAQVVYKLATPTTIQLTPQEIAALSGVNTLYTDAGTLTVTGREDPRHTIVELKNAILSLGGNI